MLFTVRLKMPADTSVVFLVLVIVNICLGLTGDAFSPRAHHYRRERSAQKKPGVISQEKCKEFSKYIVEDVVPSTFSLVKSKVQVSTCGKEVATLVIGGEKALAKEFPHMALLGYGSENDKMWKCGGSLVSEQFVLTAGHCLSTQQFGNLSWVRLGDLNIDETSDDASPEDFSAIELIKYPQYVPPSQYNDIGLVKLDRAVTFNKYIRPACLNSVQSIQHNFIATGWGLTAPHGNNSADLLKVTLVEFKQPACNISYAHKISERRLKFGIVDDSQLCAGSKSDEAKDTCQGDSGGPLQTIHQELHCMYLVVGITSIGESCGVLPGVYTRVSQYIEWLEKTMWPQ